MLTEFAAFLTDDSTILPTSGLLPAILHQLSVLDVEANSLPVQLTLSVQDRGDDHVTNGHGQRHGPLELESVDGGIEPPLFLFCELQSLQGCFASLSQLGEQLPELSDPLLDPRGTPPS